MKMAQISCLTRNDQKSYFLGIRLTIFVRFPGMFGVRQSGLGGKLGVEAPCSGGESLLEIEQEKLGGRLCGQVDFPFPGQGGAVARFHGQAVDFNITPDDLHPAMALRFQGMG